MNLGIGLGLGSRNGISQQAIVRALLFGAGEPGFFYDLSDFSTLRQDAAGTIPVTAVGQPLGLVLDKSKGMALGPELRGTATFQVDGTGPIGTYDTATGVGTIVRTDAANKSNLQFPGLVSGTTYAIDIQATSGSLSVRTNSSIDIIHVLAAPARATVYALAVGSTITVVGIVNGQTSGFIIHSIRSIAGNHASQPTAASRPILGKHPITGLRNLARQTENLADTSSWQNSDTSVATRSAGTLTLGSNQSFVYVVQTSVLQASGRWTFSADITCDQTVNDVPVRVANTNGTVAAFILVNVVAGVTQRITIPDLEANGQTQFKVGIDNRDFITPGSSDAFGYGLTLNRIQVEVGAVATAYQTVGTVWDVTEPNVPSVFYAATDGVDDFLVTNTITPGTDKAQVFAGVRKLSDIVNQIVYESSPAGNDGSVALRAPNDVGTYQFNSRGTIAVGASASGFSPPITNVVTGLGDITADLVRLRVNGTQVAQSTADQGLGIYMPFINYIGRRGGTTFPFNGRIYSLISRFGPNLTTEQIQTVEAYVNSQTGAF